MPQPRRTKPLWRWEAFLFVLVLVLAMAASLVARVEWGIAGAALAVVLLVVAVVAAALLVVPLFLPKGRDSENTRKSLAGVQLEPIDPVRTVRVLESERRQTGIEAARAKSAAQPVGVLTPDASRWLGRRLHIAVDLLADDGRLYRAGFLPPELDPLLVPRLHELGARGAAASVEVRIVEEKRPLRVEVKLDALPGGEGAPRV